MQEQKEMHKQAVANLANDPQKYIEFLEGLVIDVCELANTYEDMCNVHDCESYLDDDEAEGLRESDHLVELGMHLMMDVQNVRKEQ